MEEIEKRIVCISVICLALLFLGTLCVLLLILFVSPDKEHKHLETETVPAGSEQSMYMEETAEPNTDEKIPKITTVQNADGKQAFLLTLEEFIERYNRHYEAEHGRTWLTPAGQWYAFTGENAPFSGARVTRFEFDPDKNVHNDPDVWAYVLQEGGNLCEISLGMPEHDWTQWRYDTFREQCYYTLSLFYPELTADEIWSLIDSLYADAAANEYISLSAKPEPDIIRFRDGMGCYGFIYSGVIRINMIPVDSQTLETFTNEGGLTYGI